MSERDSPGASATQSNESPTHLGRDAREGAQDDDTEPTDKDSPTDSDAPWPKRGLAGQIHAAKTTAPTRATDMEILAVAGTAWNENRSVEDVWTDVKGGGD